MLGLVTLELRHREAGNVVAMLDKRLLVLVRSGMLTEAAFGYIGSELEATRVAGRKPVGCLSVVLEGAGMSDGAMLARQRVLMRQLLADESTSLALVTLGDSVQTAMIRSFIRVGSVGKRNIKVCSTVSEAAGWLAPRMDIRIDALERAADEAVRALSQR